MAVTASTTGSAVNGTGDASIAMTVSGSNSILIVCCAMYANVVSAITLSGGLSGGTPYQVKSQSNIATVVEIWAIPAVSGSGNVNIDVSGTNSRQFGVILLNGADQGTTPAPTGDAASTTGSTSPLSVTPSNLTADDMTIYTGSQSETGDNPQAVTGTQWLQNNNSIINAAFGYNAGTGAVSVTWGGTSTLEVVVGVRVAAAAGGAAKKRLTTLGIGNIFAPVVAPLEVLRHRKNDIRKAEQLNRFYQSLKAA